MNSVTKELQNINADKVNPTIKEQFLPMSKVVVIVGLSKTTIYDRIKKGAFPKLVDLGGGMKRFRATEVQAWMDEKIAVRDTQEVA